MSLELFIDVCNAAGVKQGPGPITTATQWTSVRDLDKAGSFSFQMPASDPRAALVQPHAYVYCYALQNGAITCQGAGIVDSITVAGGTPTLLTVTGSDLLRELTWAQTHTLAISQAGTAPIDNAHAFNQDVNSLAITGFSDFTALVTDGNLATYHDDSFTALGSGNARWLYLGYTLPFSALNLTLGGITPSNQGTGIQNYQYFNGKTWLNVSGFGDGTVAFGSEFGQSGSLTWTIPADWSLYEQDISPAQDGSQLVTLYWMRFTLICPSVTAGPVRFEEITVNAQVPTTAVLNRLLSLAHTSWTTAAALGGAGYQDIDPAHAVQTTVVDQSALTALINVGTLTYEHFRLGDPALAGGRTLVWLRRDAPASGLRAVRALEGVALEANLAACAITSLEQLTTSDQLATRLIPYGAGTSVARLTLASSTASVPAGYTVDRVNNVLVNNAIEAQWGIIEATQTWSQIGPPTTAKADLVPAANALLQVALTWLSQHATPVLSYKLSVAGLSQVLWPGQTIRVVWREVVDGYLVLDVDADLIVLEATVVIDTQGVRTSNLVVSNQPLWPVSEAEVLAREVARLAWVAAHPQMHSTEHLLAPAGTPAGQQLIVNGSGGGVYARN